MSFFSAARLRSIFVGCFLLPAVLAGCSPSNGESAETKTSEPSTSAAPQLKAAAADTDDGLLKTPEAYATRLKGQYDLWEDHEGGRSCTVTLTDEPTIGGYIARADDACLAKFVLPWYCGRGDNDDAADKTCTPKATEDVFAWFIAPNNDLVLAAVTRQPVFRFPRLKDGSYYLRRDEEQLEALVFSPADDGDKKH